MIDSVNSTSKIDDSIMSVLSSSNAIERIKRNRSELVNYYYNLKQKERERSSYSNLDRSKWLFNKILKSFVLNLIIIFEFLFINKLKLTLTNLASINMSNASIKNFDRLADSKKTPSFSERQIISKTFI